MANERRGIQSIEVGGALLRALVDHGGPMSLGELSRKAGMTAAKAHPYLVSYSNLGLIQQDAATGRYELGPFALQMGLISLQRSDPVRTAIPLVDEMLAPFGQTVALATAGSYGPTIVHIHQAADPIYVTMRTGTVMSLMQTATGQIFAAYLPPMTVDALIAIEEAGALQIGAAPKPFTRAQIEERLAEVRRQRLAFSVDDPTVGITAMSAPVFDHSHHIVLAITVIGPSGSIDPDPAGHLARALRACADTVSTRLGFSA
ncbi:IclR family transcriptional regulator [Trinickia caryophylli]|uniref:Transcriptional regulator, IclR family n=1 Tax=Trinickia caryophylli TaxID=28094 RepID=A0A1X7GUZ8_TRICW|nr:IclR family transcriptional regulator [Trinickia caryophylli]PMS09412.1 IclR family transcriptional regulator [Trinickia caryophylli]TRX18120.1 IclR family transcriptional regulator [Trinickia caryophylli]WQE11097.1 IclR family transcriptional regulator [Trinickia caryophylli]SMF74673.1 transcriptional regulator, IclR family [Trinickia caryophylli]GLU35254.1 transcriptional regulator [Trinickia caryophylli]